MDGLLVVAVPIALVQLLCGASAGEIIVAMGIFGLVGLIIGRATVPVAGPSRLPAPTAQARPEIALAADPGI